MEIPTAIGSAGLLYMVMIVLFLLYLTKRYEPRQIRELVSILHTKGGNIALLTFLSMAFFYSTVQYLYFCLTLIVNGKIQQDNAMMLMGVTILSSTAFGGTLGALITLLSGETRTSERQGDRTQPPAPDNKEK